MKEINRVQELLSKEYFNVWISRFFVNDLGSIMSDLISLARCFNNEENGVRFDSKTINFEAVFCNNCLAL